MKKVIIAVIVIAVAVAVFAVVAGQTDVVKPAEKAAAPVEQKFQPEELKRNVKFPIKAMKMPKLNIDREKLKKKNIQSKEEDPGFNQKQKKCGE